MQLTDCFNVYRTHLHSIEENKDKLQGIFDFMYRCVSFFRMMLVIPQFSLTPIYIVMSDL